MTIKDLGVSQPSHISAQIVIAIFVVTGSAASGCDDEPAINKLTYHGDPQRAGWNADESILTPESVSSPSFAQLWESRAFDSVDGVAPRLFASPLYADEVVLSSGEHAGSRLSVIFAVGSTGYAYAVNAFQRKDIPAGTILWRKRLTDTPCYEAQFGSLSTPVIDLGSNRLYVTSCDEDELWQVHALDIRSGEEVTGWPVDINHSGINQPEMNKNGPNLFPEIRAFLQRGALNLSPDASRLYIAFGLEPQSGWLIAVDTVDARIASAFSTTASPQEGVGGMWASGGPAVDWMGNVFIATGSSYASATSGIEGDGVYSASSNNWGQSIIKLSDSRDEGFTLAGTYTPFNYCQTAATDIDLGSSGTVLVDLNPAETSTPHLLALIGGKQGNAYLLDRTRMPGSLVKRQPCSDDSRTDMSLLAPHDQPHFGQPGPINLFAPYSDRHGFVDYAKSRTTGAYFRSSTDVSYLFGTGSSKLSEDSATSVPPGLARLRIVTTPGTPAYLEIDQLEHTLIFQNPGSPVVTSNGGDDAIVWVLDMNAQRSTPLFGKNSPKPVLYAIEALTFRLLWKSKPGELRTSGKYNEPTIVRGTVFVGTDRIQAFGLRKLQ